MKNKPARTIEPGIYAILDTSWVNQDEIEQKAIAVLRAGVCALQYRDKNNEEARVIKNAQALSTLCLEYETPFIMNDHPELALTCKADGVHLGKDDADIHVARKILGKQAIIGCSCYASVERAKAAAEAGASYVAFGRFFKSSTKPEASPADIDILSAARTSLEIPIVAIGGITPENLPQLVAKGIDAAAIIGGIFASNQPHQSTLRYRSAFFRAQK